MLAELTYEAQYIDKLLILWLSGHQWPKRYLSKPRSGVLVEFRVGPVIFLKFKLGCVSVLAGGAACRASSDLRLVAREISGVS